jgi:hypothetical protein
MAFLSFPIYFIEGDLDEERANLGFKPRRTKGQININTFQICAYNSNDNGHTMVRMSNGDVFEIPITIEGLESILSKTEVLIDLANVLSEN